MKRRRLKIDWDQLEEAFSRPPGEVISYLDRVTGRIVLEGEGEEEPAGEDDAPLNGPPPKPRTVAPLRDDAVRLYVHPPDDERKIEWVRGFLDGDRSHDEEIRQEIEDALACADPLEELGEIFNDYAAVRDAWFVYRDERVHEMIEKWLEANGVEPIDPPPWRS